jgi:hypothetical protein
MVNIQNVLCGDAVGRDQSRQDTQTNLVGTLEERVTGCLREDFGCFLRQQWKREQQQQEQVAHAFAFLPRAQRRGSVGTLSTRVKLGATRSWFSHPRINTGVLTQVASILGTSLSFHNERNTLVPIPNFTPAN